MLYLSINSLPRISFLPLCFYGAQGQIIELKYEFHLPLLSLQTESLEQRELVTSLSACVIARLRHRVS